MKRFVVIAAVLLAPLAASASNVGVSPVIIRADDSERVLSLDFTNKGTAESTYEVQIERWVQRPDGTSIKEPTRELISAPIVKIAPGAKRTIRLARQQTGTASYVLTLRELLPPRKDGEKGLRLSTEFRVPAIFEDKEGAVVLSATQTTDGILLSNTGSLAAHITSVGLTGAPAWKSGHLGWALPGGTALLPYQANGAAIDLRINDKVVSLQVN